MWLLRPVGRAAGEVASVSALDILLALFALLLVVVGFWKGLARTFFGIVGLLAAFLVASRFSDRAAGWFAFTGWSSEARLLIGYIALFILVGCAAELLGWLVRKLLSAAQLGWVDRLAGGALGLVAAVLTTALLVLPLIAYAPGGAAALDRSTLAPYVVAVADLAAHLVPADLAARYRDGVDKLRRHWRGDWGREVVTNLGKGARDGNAGRGWGA